MSTSELTNVEQRSLEFLGYVAARADNPMTTIWGPYRCFDGYALALLATGDLSGARAQIHDTIEMIEENFAAERADPNYKWHLADFAIHPLLRAWLLYGQTTFQEDQTWERVLNTARTFLLHFGDLSENHNLLHLSLRYLFAQVDGDAMMIDGRPASIHGIEAKSSILEWLDKWTRRGSSEWGADIYYNINFLALYNLVDFAADLEVASLARRTLDLFFFDMCADYFHGAIIGAARRAYSCYRIDLACSPVRPLLYLYLGPHRPDVPPEDHFNLNFIGGAIQAALSHYRPPIAALRLARLQGECCSGSTHQVALWPGQSFLSKRTYRTRDVALSSACAPGGKDGRYTEQLVQATLGERALVFMNHPGVKPHWKEDDGLADAKGKWETDNPVSHGHPLWFHGNCPPGEPHGTDIRPGFWQGNGHGPRTCGFGRMALVIFNIDPVDPLPAGHAWFPREQFDEVVSCDGWHFARKDHAFVALWSSVSTQWQKVGVWKNIELQFSQAKSAHVIVVGCALTHARFNDFIVAAERMHPSFNESDLLLTSDAIDRKSRPGLSWNSGPTLDGEAYQPRMARLWNPLATLSTGEVEIEIYDQ